MLWRNFCYGNGCRIRRYCETMENRRNYTSSASQIQTEDKRLQSGTNSGGRTWEKAGSSREQRCSKENSENATSERAWEQRQDSKSKRSIWCHKILDSEKMCAGHRLYLYNLKYHTQSGKGVEKCRSTKSIFFDHKHWTRTLTV